MKHSWNINSVQSILSKPDTATSFYILITWFQLASGISHPILENTNNPLNYVNRIWTKDFIRLLNTYNVKLKMNFTYCALPQRENYSFKMDDIHSIVSSNSDLENLNIYRLYLNISILSDIATIIGNSIIPNILFGDKSNFNHLPISSLGNFGLALLHNYIATIIKH